MVLLCISAMDKMCLMESSLLSGKFTDVYIFPVSKICILSDEVVSAKWRTCSAEAAGRKYRGRRLERKE